MIIVSIIAKIWRIYKIGVGMKKYLIHLILSSSLLFAQSPFDLPDDSASFGVFIFDYPTGGFEEGTVLNVPLCNNCVDLNVIALIQTLNPPS
jgi:hypothetical protein